MYEKVKKIQGAPMSETESTTRRDPSRTRCRHDFQSAEDSDTCEDERGGVVVYERERYEPRGSDMILKIEGFPALGLVGYGDRPTSARKERRKEG